MPRTFTLEDLGASPTSFGYPHIKSRIEAVKSVREASRTSKETLIEALQTLNSDHPMPVTIHLREANQLVLGIMAFTLSQVNAIQEERGDEPGLDIERLVRAVARALREDRDD